MTTTPDVGRLAQSETQLELNTIAVIGLFTGPSGDSALLRMRNGRIVKVAPGDTADTLTVLAIDEHAVAVRDRRGQVFKLALPGAA